jgi:hypothetical protein
MNARGNRHIDLGIRHVNSISGKLYNGAWGAWRLPQGAAFVLNLGSASGTGNWTLVHKASLQSAKHGADSH